MRSRSFTAAGMSPSASRESIFSAIVLPTPARSVARPWAASSATDLPDSRMAFAALR
jgi:hypothetical protein